MRFSPSTFAGLTLLSLIAITPLRAEDIKPHIQKAQEAANQQNWDAALTELDAAIAIDKNNVEAHSGRALILIKKQDLKGAITELSRVIELDPKNAGAYNIRATLYQQTGENAKAKDDIVTFLRLSPAELDKLQTSAQEADDQHDWEKAVNMRSILVAVRPDDAKLQYAMGMTLKNSYYTVFMNNTGNANFQENLDKLKADTKASFEAAIKADPKFTAAYLAEGDSDTIARGLKLMPENADLLAARGDLSLQGLPGDESIKSALDDYSHALKIDPKNAGAFAGRARAYMWDKKYDLALADSARSLELKPGNFEVLKLRGSLYGLKNDYANEAAEDERALAVNPSDATLAFSRYIALSHLPDKAPALTAIGKLIDKEPSNVIYRTSRARLYVEQKDYAKASADVEKALTLEADNQDALELKAKIAAASK